MQRFTARQEQFLLWNRREFNRRQEVMASTTLANVGEVGDMIGNAETLPRDVWGEWDRDAVELQRDILAVYNDLAASVSTPMPIGKLIHHFRTLSDSGDVNVSLDGRSKARSDQPLTSYHGTPLPIFDSRFGYGWRQMAAASTEGFSLEPEGRLNANRKVAERLEAMCLDGESSIVVDGNQLYGMRNHPKRNTRTTGQALNGATGPQWVADVTATLKLLHDANFRVPVTLYVNFDDWFYASNTDYSTQYPNKSIAQRVREIDGIREVVVGSKINASEMFAVVKNRQVVQVLNGMPMMTRAQFRHNPEDDYDFIVMAAQALEIKFDHEDQCGIAHSSI